MFGLDLGNKASVLAVVTESGAADTLPNAIGSRTTPTAVGYGAQQRFLGEAAVAQKMTNCRNTIEGIPALLGRCTVDTDAVLSVTEAGGDGVRVIYRGAEVTIATQAVVGAFVGGIVRMARANSDLGAPEPAIVLAVPSYFSGVQRQSLHHAATVGGARVANLCEEADATALFYAHERLSNSAPAPDTLGVSAILFIDSGHNHTTAFLALFDRSARALRVVDQEVVLVGGRDFDRVLASKFEADFQLQKSTPISSERARLRLLLEAEKAKEVLSANGSYNTMVEELQDGLDFSVSAQRIELNSACDSASKSPQSVSAS